MHLLSQQQQPVCQDDHPKSLPFGSRLSSSLIFHFQPNNSDKAENGSILSADSSSASNSNTNIDTISLSPSNPSTTSFLHHNTTDQPHLHLLHISALDDRQVDSADQGFAQDTLNTLSTLMDSKTDYTETARLMVPTPSFNSFSMSSLDSPPPLSHSLLSASQAVRITMSDTPEMWTANSTSNITESSPTCTPTSHPDILLSACLLPQVGRDKRRYGSLDAAALNDEDVLLSISTAQGRPFSSMEQVEAWLPTPGYTNSPIMDFSSNRSRRSTSDSCHPLEQPTAGLDAMAIAHTPSTPRISSNQQFIHPSQLDPESRPFLTTCSISSTESSPTLMNSSASANETWQPPSSHLKFQQQQQQQQQQPQPQQPQPQHYTVRKKSSFASRIRRVFSKPGENASTKDHEFVAGNVDMSQQHRVHEDVISMASHDKSSRSFHPGPLIDKHRGSVSSSSSIETMSVGQGEVGVITPLTSPEMSPLGSPGPKYNSLPFGPESAAVPEATNLQLPTSSVIMSEPNSRRPSTPIAIAVDSVPITNMAEKRQSLEPTPTRTVKKRLSFASLTSFFQPRVSETATAQAMKKKQQRSSSVPNVEQPLMIVGRQVAGFQRRHSLNDMESSGKGYAKQQESPYKHIASSWDKGRVSFNTSAASVNKSSDPKASSSTKSKIHGVFGKQVRKKNKNSKGEVASESLSEEPVAIALHTKPLRSALVRRLQRTPSIKRGPSYRTSIYEQSAPTQYQYDLQASVPGRRFPQCEPMVNHSMDVGTSSRHSSLKEQQQQTARVGERIVGPTRHRRQSSIASRQASQPGYHPANDRRRSYRYSTSEEFDTMQYSNIMTPEHYSPQIQSSQILQQCQQSPFQSLHHHQHPDDYETFARQSTQGIHPMATIPPFSQGVITALMPYCDQISSMAAEEGSVTPIPGVAESYPTPSPSSQISSPPTSPTNAYNIAVAPTVTSRNLAAANHIRGDDSYQQGNSGNNGVGCNSHHNSLTVPRGGHPSADQALIMETQSACPSSPRSGDYLGFINNHQHYFQQQQQIQIQQQMHAQQQQQEQIQIHHQILAQQQQQQQQTFTTSFVPHTLVQDPFAPYSYPFQFNKQQYLSPQHPLSYHQQYPEHYVNQFNQFGMTTPSESPPSLGLLRPVRQLHFSPEPKIHITWTADQYDRSSDPNITAHRLTPAIAQKIKLELNQFKSQEMIVHQESRIHTHFFV